MQIRCYSCKMPISISREMVNQALNIIQEDELVYFDFRCPKCKKSNRVSKEQLLHAAPGWQFIPVKKKVEEKKPAATTKKADKKKPVAKTKEKVEVKKPAAKSAKKVEAKKPAAKTKKADDKKPATKSKKKTEDKKPGSKTKK